MEQYLLTGGRSKGEWFPDNIAGLMRASRAECIDDIDFIVGSLPVSAQAAAAAAAPEDAEAAEGEGEEAEAAAAAAAASSAAAGGRGGARQKRKSKHERAADELAAEAAASKRARLQIKIQQERSRLESTKESGYHLRQTLDQLRAETQQYEDAIAQTKREMEMIQRETQILEERLNQSRSEYFWGLDQADRIRIEEERIEAQLREQLSQTNTQVNDVSDRVHQLRQLEEEFIAKDVRIQQLETEIAKYETQIALMNQIINNKQFGIQGPAAAEGAAPAASAAAAAAQPGVAPAAAASAAPSLVSALAVPAAAIPAPSPVPPVAQPGVVPDPNLAAAAAQTVSAPAAPADASVPVKDEAIKTDTDASMAVEPSSEAAAVPVKAEEPAAPAAAVAPADVSVADPAAAAAAAPSAAVTAGVPTPAAAPVAAAGAASAPLMSSSIGPLLPIPTTASIPELLASIQSSTSTIAQLSMSLRLHEEQLESSNRHLLDRDRAMKYMTEQIERFSNLNHELNYKLKAAETLTLEERAKLEQSYKQILFAQRQKEEQAALIVSYEEKLKVFEQLLNVADVRAAAAEEHVSECMQTVKTSRMASQVLQLAYNKIVKEYERAVKDKYAAMEEIMRSKRQDSAGHHAHNVSIDSNASDAAASPRPSAAMLSLGAIKEEHHMERDSGFGGVNGLASPMDAPHRPAHYDAAMAHGGHALGARFDAAMSHMPLPSPSLSHSDSSESHYQRINLQLTQQNKELSIKLNQVTHQNTQLQVALVKLAHRAHKSAPLLFAASASLSASAGFSPSASPPPAAAAAASSSSPLLGAAHSPNLHASHLAHHAAASGVKAEAASHPAAALNGHVAPRTPDRAQAMDIDGAGAMSLSPPMAAAVAPAHLSSGLSSSVPLLSSSTHPLLAKSSSGGSAAAAAYRTSSSSPLPTPRSPLPPLHPNKPVFHEDAPDI